jgi:NCS2 family nucleobase:cation symporter-2
MTVPVHPVGERLPLVRLFPLALQHVLVMYAGAVAVPLIIGRALKLFPEDVVRAEAQAVGAAAEHV